MDTIVSGHAAALWAGLHLFLLLTLSLLVVRLRQKHKVALGDEGIPELARAIRAFGNASEYVPTGIAALAVLAVAGASPLA
ncbi:MAG TPA: MAPEG family protein, partial [Caulobacter sp.]|nr:MAPEG family protein [Caulobacter sp.]